MCIKCSPVLPKCSLVCHCQSEKKALPHSIQQLLHTDAAAWVLGMQVLTAGSPVRLQPVETEHDVFHPCCPIQDGLQAWTVIAGRNSTHGMGSGSTHGCSWLVANCLFKKLSELLLTFNFYCSFLLLLMASMQWGKRRYVVYIDAACCVIS